VTASSETFDNEDSKVFEATIQIVAPAEINVVHTYRVAEPKKAAQVFSIFLAVEKGYSNKMKRIPGGWRVLTDEGQGEDDKAVDFILR
jgi:hypothetical protein